MRVALLQNFVAPYRVSLYERLAARITALKVFVSTPMESDRNWKVEWGTLDVVVQKNLTLHMSARHAIGFKRFLQVHIPYDMIPQLWSFRPDVAISVELGLRSLQAVIYKLLRPSSQLMLWCKLSEHTERSWGLPRRLLRRFLLAQADGVMVNGESGARYIASFGVPDNRIFRVNQPVDVSAFANSPRTRPDDARLRLLCCGVLTSRKGVLPFLTQLSAWASAHPDTPLEIWWLGDGNLRPTLESFPCSPNLTQQFIGHVQYAELPHWYSQMDILVFPTLLDEWGLVVNEAMASGLPILGSIYAQAVTELVTEGETGWVFDPCSTVSVQSALDRLFQTSPDSLAAMRANARQRIAQLTPETTALKIMQAIRVITGDGSLKKEPVGKMASETSPGVSAQNG